MTRRAGLSAIATALALWSHGALAAPTLEARDAAPIRITSASTIASFRPFTYYAAAAYCDPGTILEWNCGANCAESPNFTPTAAGGDGNGVQFWFVGYDSGLKSVIVSHQGTDPTQFLSVLTDVQLWRTSLPAADFPGIPSGVSVHDGFLDSHIDTRAVIRTAVTSATTKYATKKVVFVGHSLGAAIAILDAAYFRTNFPSLQISVRSYGLPRVGNADWANWADANLGDHIRITNTEDPIPIVPGRFLGYKHTSGEVHVVNTLLQGDQWYTCAGQDNTSPNCSIGDTPNVFGANILDHLGPYDGILMGLCWLNGKKH